MTVFHRSALARFGGVTVTGIIVFKTALLLFMPHVCGCSFYESSLLLKVHLPPVPDHWQSSFPDLTFRIVYPLPHGGGFEERLVDCTARVALELPKILYVPVLAYPKCPIEDLQLLPAGGLYPIDYEDSNDSLTLSWQQGAVAEVLRRLWTQGMDCSAINVARLRREMTGRCQGDPWALDLQRICEKLASEEFRLTEIRLAASRDLLLEPGPGQWFLESPFRRPVTADPGGCVLLKAVPLGAHLLFESAGTSCYFLYVGAHTVLVSTH